MADPTPPHIAQAGRQLPTLITLALVFGDAGLLALAGAIIADTMPALNGLLPLRAIGLVGSAALIPAAGFAAAAMLAFARQRLALPVDTPATPPRDASWIATWPMAVATAAIALLAAVGVVWSRGLASGADAGAVSGDLFTGGGLVLLGFPVLVLERIYANTDPRSLPEAPQLQWLLRVPLAALVLLGIAAALRGAGFSWAGWIEQGFVVLLVLIAVELVARAAARFFLPFAPLDQAHSIADSTLARMFRLAPPNVTSINVAVERQFGIDLSRSWAIGFVTRATIPVGFAMLLLGWGLSGVTSLRLDQRAVYERFGVPLRVVGPGLHLGLPWPFGIMHRVEYGVLHDTPVAVSDAALVTGGGFVSGTAGAPVPGAEDTNPAGADRLWDQTHANEASYLVASASGGRQNFQSVDIDIRLIYRVGLSDQAAMAAAYRVDDPERLIRAAAGQLLARYFASHTLLGVLVANRDTFSAEFRNELQAELDRMNSGQEILAVIVEAIHPPPGAAKAYHAVQAAEISSKVSIANETGAAERNRKEAQEEATRIQNQAIAAAAETLSGAESEQKLFEGDDVAYIQGGRAFLLERWFDRARTALARAHIVVMDHRLSGAAAPTIDLRAFAPAAATLPPPESR